MEEKAVFTEAELKKRALSEAGISYSLCAALPMLLSLVLSLILSAASGGREANWYAGEDWYRYLCYLLPQLCFAASALIWFRRSGVSPKAAYRGCKWYYFPVAVALQFGLMFSLSALNEYFVALLELGGYRRQGGMLPSLGGWNLLPAILVIALLPALFEETVFRDILTRQMKENEWGFWAIVLVSGALFSLFHHNPEQTIYQFICGACFALVALRSESVFPTMVAHFLNNAVILALTAAYTPALGEDFLVSDLMPAGGYIALIVISALCLAGALAFLVLFKREKGEKNWGVTHGKAFFFAATVGIALSGITWIVTLVSGFLA